MCSVTTQHNQANKAKKAKIGVLLTNIGSPDALDLKSVKRYLRRFLGDPRVIDIPAVVRYPLVYGVIVPTRAKASLAAYKTVWDETAGSPLIYHTEQLKVDLQALLDTNKNTDKNTDKNTQHNHQEHDYQVVVGMRYSQPSLENAIDELMRAQCTHIHIIPLYPQYASSVTESAFDGVKQALAHYPGVPNLHFHSSFYNKPLFLDAWQQVIQNRLAGVSYDYLLMSFHGLPVRQAQKTKDFPAFHYPYQCEQTAHHIAQRLGLQPAQYGLSYQSKVGKLPWLTPSTEEYIERLYDQGIRHLAVACPSFVSDCLETLEEIGEELKEKWMDLGGRAFYLVPCLNDHPTWVATLGEMITGKVLKSQKKKEAEVICIA